MVKIDKTDIENIQLISKEKTYLGIRIKKKIYLSITE